MKVFLDTNVLVSAFATRGLCADVLRHVLAEHTLVTGDVVLTELRRVLRLRFRMPVKNVQEIERFLRENEVVPKPRSPSKTVIRDPDDAWVLASAEAAGADVLVTSDRDLLDIAGEASLDIVDPRGFWDLVREQ
ncbi:MAG: putative toxin-antitoxin system toxin component, PIN family [Acidobacteria bacterium]|nr:putative toxin-antitoxin system toxin component, PIN family [Acidobacteriota bacterium]